MPTTIRKNGKAYDSGDARVTIFGSELEVEELSYNTNQESQVNHGTNYEATSWSMGKITHQATITLAMNSSKKLEKASGGNLLSIAPFDINVTFVNEFNEIINDTITCKFTGQGRSIDGGMNLKYQHPLLVLGIDYNNL